MRGSIFIDSSKRDYRWLKISAVAFLLGLLTLMFVGCAGSVKRAEPMQALTVNTSLGGVAYPLAKAQGVIERLQENVATIHQRGAEAGSRITQAVLDDAKKSGDLVVQAQFKADEAQAKVEFDAQAMKALSNNNTQLAYESGGLRKEIGDLHTAIGEKNRWVAALSIVIAALVAGIVGFIVWKVWFK